MAKEKILVVDDEEDIIELVRFNLSKDGYRIDSSLTGEDALKKVRSDSFDLIILDLMLPGIDGLEVTRKLRDNPKTRSVPIVMLTAKGEEPDIVTGLELGADDYITKPFSPRILIARVRAVLRRKIGSSEDGHSGTGAANDDVSLGNGGIDEVGDAGISPKRDVIVLVASGNPNRLCFGNTV
ncbi:MAG: response regulator, partial [Desulfobacterales bacterium]|nr:response regulator [Desulfobacterales bacterium]